MLQLIKYFFFRLTPHLHFLRSCSPGFPSAYFKPGSPQNQSTRSGYHLFLRCFNIRATSSGSSQAFTYVLDNPTLLFKSCCKWGGEKKKVCLWGSSNVRTTDSSAVPLIHTVCHVVGHVAFIEQDHLTRLGGKHLKKKKEIQSRGWTLPKFCMHHLKPSLISMQCCI